MGDVHGKCQPQFREVYSLLENFISSGDEVGASLTVNIDGDDVVNIWGGYVDQGKQEPWEQDTIVNVWSTTKTVASLAALMLIDRGIVKPDDKVAKHWPDFGANGKDAVEVRHIFSHTSGVPGWDVPVTLTDICDFDKACDLLAKQRPWWEPGSMAGYHTITHGHLIDKLVRVTTGMTLKQFIAEEIARPLGADFQLGVKASDLARVSDLIPFSPNPSLAPNPDWNSTAAKVFLNPAIRPGDSNTSLWRNAELGGANGHGNSQAVAKILSVISRGGEVNGVRLLKPETIDLIFQEQANGMDVVAEMRLRWGMGFGIRGEGAEPLWLPQGRICFWGGLGGSIVVMDLDRKMTIAYVMNRMWETGLGSHCTRAYVESIYRSLEQDS